MALTEPFLLIFVWIRSNELNKARSGSRRADLLFNALDVPAAEGFYLASKLKVSRDICIFENAETVHNGDRSPRPLHHLVRLQL